MDNNSVIASGGGSPQARWANECCRGGDCPVCNPPDPETCGHCSEELEEDLNGDLSCRDCDPEKFEDLEDE